MEKEGKIVTEFETWTYSSRVCMCLSLILFNGKSPCHKNMGCM